MTSNPQDRQGQNDLVRRFREARRANTPLISIATPDQFATVRLLAKNGNGGSVPTPKLSWNLADGFAPVNAADEPSIRAIAEATGGKPSNDPATALQMAAKLPQRTILFFHNAQRFIAENVPGSTMIMQRISNLRDVWKEDKRTLVLLGPHVPLPPELANDVVELDEPLPGETELTAICRYQAEAWEDLEWEPTDDLLTRAAAALKGCSAFGAEQLFAMAARKEGIDFSDLNSSVQKMIEQTPGLGYERGKETFDDVGGLTFAKEYGSRMFQGPLRPAVIVRIEEIEKAMSGVSGDTSGVRQDALQVILSAMEDFEWDGLLAFGPPGCQPAGEPVLMADGTWKSCEDVKLGDAVLSPQLDGTVVASTVIGTRTWLNQPIYRIKQKGFSNRTYLASGDHILPLIGLEAPRRAKGLSERAKNYQKYQTLTVEEFVSRGKNYQKKARIFTSPAVDIWPEREFPLHPYVVGAFLGDGGWSGSKGATPSYTTGDEILIEAQKSLGVEFGKPGIRPGKRIAKIIHVNYVGETRHKLESLGFRGKKSAEKSIPLQYLTASLSQRLELLAGLIDTDGTAIAFCSISPVLAQQFAWLVHSVGGVARVKEINWDDKMGRRYRVYSVGFSFVEHRPPVRLIRKQQPVRNVKWKNPRHRAFTVEYETHGTVYGFSLDSSSQLFITRDWLVTHNSGKSLFGKSLANTFGARPLTFDINATQSKWVGESGSQIRRALKVLEAIGGSRVFFIASCNDEHALNTALKRRFTAGTWFFDVPSAEDREQIWEINRARYHIPDGDVTPDEDGMTGADIRKICKNAYRLGCGLAEAMRFTVLLKSSDQEIINQCREQAKGRFIDAANGGTYNGPAARAGRRGARKIQTEE